MFGVNLLLKRRITLPKAQTSIYLHDIVVNEGSRPAPLMMLYHMNFGYPFFGPETQLVLDPLVTTDRERTAGNRLEDILIAQSKN